MGDYPIKMKLDFQFELNLDWKTKAAILHGMNGPRRTACFAKRMPDYTFSTLNSTWFSYTPATGLYKRNRSLSADLLT